jgi:hypothetical protein
MIPASLTKGRKNISLPLAIGAAVGALLVLLFIGVTLAGMGTPTQSDVTVQVPFK